MTKYLVTMYECIVVTYSVDANNEEEAKYIAEYGLQDDCIEVDRITVERDCVGVQLERSTI